MMRLWLPAVLWSVACASEPCPVPWSDEMTDPDSAAFAEFVDAHLDAANIAGAGVGLVRDGEVLWTGGFGYADAPAEERVEPDTLFMLASISKLFTAASVMQLADRGTLDLDAPLGSVLPFDIVNPAFDKPLTTRQLLQHRSSIRDRPAVIWRHYGDGDSDEALGDWVRDYLHPDGAHYRRSNFHDYAPGAKYAYSNVGYALLGWIVEVVDGRPYHRQSRAELLEPLGLYDTAWLLADLDRDRIAHPHRRRLGPGHGAMDHYGYPDYPNGQLRTTPADLGRFLGVITRGAAPDVLSRGATADLMTHGWKRESVGGRNLRGHGGSDRGVRTEAWISETTGNGYVLLLNTRLNTDAQRRSVQCLRNGLLDSADGFR